ncbi:MAG: hypothetical protein HXY25_12000 [Alphaproteobacteria bacterium]|nr:hypothetical protein [Alphaproteobacteria bacterium]
MRFHARRWTRLSVALATGTALAAGPLAGGLAEAGDAGGSAPMRLAGLFGGEGDGGEGVSRPADGGGHRSHGAGAGEGGEGEGSSSAADPATDTAAYLTGLSLMRGHLRAGIELYRLGAAEAALTHMKHPRDEIYTDLEPAFAARGAAGFADALEALASGVRDGAPLAEVEAAYAQLLSAMDAAEAAAAPGRADRFRSATALLRSAAEEYAVAYDDAGMLRDAHEYQDAYGFTGEARRQIEAAGGPEADEALAVVSALAPLWPALVPPDRLETDASQLFGAAAKLEIIALGVS